MSDTAPSPSGLLTRGFVALLIVSFFSSFISSPLYSLLPVYVDKAHLGSPLFAGFLKALFLILGGLFAVPAGMLCDMLGVKRILILGIVGPLLAGFIFLTGDPLILVALCIGLGATFGFSSTGGQSYLLGAVSPSVIGLASAGYFLGSTLGTASGSLFAGPIADALGYQALGMVACIASVCLIAGALFLLPELPRSGESIRSVSRSFAGYLSLLRRREVRLLLGIRYLPTCYWGAVTLLVPLLISRISGTNTSATTYTAISLTVAGAFQILTGRLCDRIGRWRPILISAACVALSALGLALTAHTLPGLYIFGVIASASAWSLSTTMPGLLKLTARDGEEGRVVGIAHVAWSAGMLSGNLGGGKLIEWGPTLPFGIAVVLCVGAVACGVGLYRVHRAADPPPGAPSK